MKTRNTLQYQLAHKPVVSARLLYTGGFLAMAMFIGVFAVTTGRSATSNAAWFGLSAKAVGQHVQLDWKTVNEREMGFYQVERSFDGVTYEEIGHIQAAGKPLTTSFYSFQDMGAHHIEKPAVYYRVKQVRPDGGFTYSRILAFDLNHRAPISLEASHSPESGELMVRYASLDREPIDFRMVNASGKVVMRKNLPLKSGSGEMSVDVSTWNSGVYYLQVYNSSTTKMEKLVLR